MQRSRVLWLAVLAVACTEHPPTATEDALTAPPAAMDILAPAVNDAVDRLVPALENRAGANRIRLALLDFEVQLEGDRGGVTSGALRSLHRAIGSYTGDPSSEADLAAIQLVLDHAEALFEAAALQRE